MYFTNTPSLNSMEAIMKQPPGYRQRGGGRKRKPYQYTKADCSCRLCPHYQGKRGCAVSVCPVLDIRLECSAAPLEEAVQSTFSEVTHTPFKQRLQRIYKEKRGGEWLPYDNGKQYPELLIANYDTTERARSSIQLTLFGEYDFDPRQILNERIICYETN